MIDLTILYYTANTIDNNCAEKVRENLLQITKNEFPIISISQKPINFGKNICVGEIGQSPYNCYRQIFIGVQEVKTKYVACCEDDTLYNMEHFSHRPFSDNSFAYNCSLWQMHRRLFWKKDDVDSVNTGMCCCISTTDLLLKNLRRKFRKYSTEPLPREVKWQKKRWQEPGRTERILGLHSVEVEYFKTKEPIIVFNRMGSLSGRQCRNGVQRIETNCLYPFGSAQVLWSKFWK